MSPPADPIVIRPARRGDFRAVGRLHVDALPLGFLSTLGTGFLTALYQGIACEPGSGVWVAEHAGRVVGFLAGTRDIRTCYRRVLRRRAPALAFAMLPHLVRPSIWRRAFETLRYPRESAEAAPRPAAELLAIAVDAAVRGRGIGRRLIEQLDEACRGWGVAEYCVPTHAVDPDSNAFYRAVGLRLARAFVHHGRPMHEYRRQVPRR